MTPQELTAEPTWTWEGIKDVFAEDLNAYVKQEMMSELNKLNIVMPDSKELKSKNMRIGYGAGQMNMLVRMKDNINNYKGGK